MLKADVNVTAPILTEIFKQIWEKGQIPEAWKTGLIFKLPKKGDLGDCNNWRGITLLSLTSKVFSRIVLSRLTAVLEKDLRPQQAGFHPGRSCSDHIFTLRQILEQSKEWNIPLYINFIDLEKAFDSIHQESLWKILRHYGVPAKLVRVIAMLYSDFKSQVICDSDLTEAFNVSTGVKQGCIFSPFLFILAMDWIMKNSTDGERRGIKWTMTMTATTTAGRSGLCQRYCSAVTPPPRHAEEDRCHGNNSWKPWLKGRHQEDKGHENERQSPRKHQTEWR